MNFGGIIMRHNLTLLIFLVGSSLSAMEFQSIGHKGMSMGGTGVAFASGSTAGYYNPALLTDTRKCGALALGVGIGVREDNLGEQIDKLSDIKFEETLDNIADNINRAVPINLSTYQGHNIKEDRDNIIEAQNLLKSIGTQNGISVMPSVYFSGRIENFGLGVYGTSEISVTAHVDTNRLDLSIEDPDNPGVYYRYDPIKDQYSRISEEEYNRHSIEVATKEGGTTYIDGKGLILIEIPISYARKYDLNAGELSVGGSLKYMQGTTYTQRLDIETKSDDTTDELDKNKKDSSNVGVDLGLLFKPKKLEKLSIGLVAKNINSPSFDTSNGNDITVDPQIRTGVSYQATEHVDLALDLDLTKNETFIPGYDSQQLGFGVNYHPVSWFSLRGGLMSNLADSNEGVVYTTGFGIGHEKFSLDVAAQLASKTGTYGGEDIPKYARVNVALTSRW
jgi:hypothetical protein